MKKIPTIGQFEFIILVIINESKPNLKSISENLSKRFKRTYTMGWISRCLSRLEQEGVVKSSIKGKRKLFKLTKIGGYYINLYNQL